MGKLKRGAIVQRTYDNRYLPGIHAEIIEYSDSNSGYDMYYVTILEGDKAGYADFWGDKYFSVVKTTKEPTWEL